MNIKPSIEVRTTGRSDTAGGFFYFKVIKKIKQGEYLIGLSSGQKGTLKSRDILISGKRYKAPLSVRKELLLEKTEQVSNDVATLRNTGSSKSELDKLSEKLLGKRDIKYSENLENILFQQQGRDDSWKVFPDLPDSHPLYNLGTSSMVLIPLMILFKSRNYKGLLTIEKQKKQPLAQNIVLLLDNDKIQWKFEFSNLETRPQFTAFTDQQAYIDHPPPEWEALLESIEKKSFQCHRKIKFLRNCFIKTENRNEELTESIDIRI